MLKSKRYLYVGFMCNQVIEKIFKAYYVKEKGTQPPYTHKLIRLAEESNLYKLMDEKQKDFLDVISPLNIEARYPTQKQDLLGSLNNDKCKNIIKETEELVKWIKKKLES
jgi:HEPN domain-containing protein